jgi:hypothetical protein
LAGGGTNAIVGTRVYSTPARANTPSRVSRAIAMCAQCSRAIGGRDGVAMDARAGCALADDDRIGG